MKITIVSGGGRKNGNGQILINEVLKQFDDRKPEVEVYYLGEMNIHPCKGCFACRKKELCVCQDEMDELRERLVESDFVIFQTPIYMNDATGSFRLMINRLYPLLSGEPGRYTKRHKNMKAMLITTQGAPTLFFSGATKRIKKILESFGFQFIGTVRAGLCNKAGAVAENQWALKRIAKICAHV